MSEEINGEEGVSMGEPTGEFTSEEERQAAEDFNKKMEPANSATGGAVKSETYFGVPIAEIRGQTAEVAGKQVELTKLGEDSKELGRDLYYQLFDKAYPGPKGPNIGHLRNQIDEQSAQLTPTLAHNLLGEGTRMNVDPIQLGMRQNTGAGEPMTSSVIHAIVEKDLRTAQQHLAKNPDDTLARRHLVETSAYLEGIGYSASTFDQYSDAIEAWAAAGALDRSSTKQSLARGWNTEARPGISAALQKNGIDSLEYFKDLEQAA